MQEVRARKRMSVDSIFGEFGFEYATAGKIASPSDLHSLNEVCRVRSCRVGLTDLAV